MVAGKKMNSRELLQALRQQHFKVERTKNGLKVQRHGKTVMFHESTVDGHGRGYLAVIKDLKHIGFQDPEAYRARKRRGGGQPKGEVPGTFPCPFGCGEGPWPYARNQGRHVATKHKGEVPLTVNRNDRGSKPESTPTLPPAKAASNGRPAATPVVTKKVEPEPEPLPEKLAGVADIERLVAEAERGAAAVKRLVVLVGPLVQQMGKERDEYRDKYERLVAKLSEAVDEV